LKFITVIQHLLMTYRSHHCSATLLCSSYISVFMLAYSCALCSMCHIRSMLYASPVHFLTLFMLYSSLHTIQLVLQRNNNISLSRHISFIHDLIICYTLHLQCSMLVILERSRAIIPMLRNMIQLLMNDDSVSVTES